MVDDIRFGRNALFYSPCQQTYSPTYSPIYRVHSFFTEYKNFAYTGLPSTHNLMLPQSGWIFHFRLSGGCSPLADRGLGRFFGVEDEPDIWISPATGEGYRRPWLRIYPKTAVLFAAATTPSPSIAEIGLTAGMTWAIYS